MEEIKDTLNDIYNKLLFLYNDKLNEIEQTYNNKLNEMEQTYNDRLNIISNNYQNDLKKIENDASTFKNFGLIRNLTNENNELNRKVSSLLKEVETCKIKYNNLLFDYKNKLSNENLNKEEENLNNQKVDNKEENFNNELLNNKEDEKIDNKEENFNNELLNNKEDEKIDNKEENENLNNQILNNKEVDNEIEELDKMKKIKIKGNSFYLSNKLVNNTYKFYDSNNIEVGYKTSSGKFYFNKL
jgi:hypothetical protein